MIDDKPLNAAEREVFNQYLADDAREHRLNRHPDTRRSSGRFYMTLLIASVGVWATLLLVAVNLIALALR